MLKEVYPIGTKVIITRGDYDFAIMIIGRIIKIDNDSFHDYAGVYYPVGYSGKNDVVKFQEEEIKRVIKLGYIDEIEKAESEKIKNVLG